MAESDVVRVAREYREQLARNEHEALRRMSRYWVKIEKKLQNDLEALAREVLDRQAKGQAVPRQFIYTLQRYRSMVEQVNRELPGYQSTVEDLIKEYQRKDYLLGLDAANAEIKATKPSSDVWTRVYKDAAETMAGFAGNGAPLYELLRHDYAETSESILDALVEGVARGKGYREVAKDMRDAMGMEYDRSLRIARTEINRSYRLANAEQYRRSGVVEKVLRLCYKPTACFACLMLDGEECPKGICDDHPNGKCTTIVTTTGGITPEWQTGSEWLEEQSPEDQRRIMGAGRYELWKNEGVNPRYMVWMKPNPVWGGSPSVKSLEDLGFGYRGKDLPKTYYMSLGQDQNIDWSGTTGVITGKEQQAELIERAKKAGIKIYAINKFDGDVTILQEQIDAISQYRNEFPEIFEGYQPLTITFREFTDKESASFAETRNLTITYNSFALRDREFTMAQISGDFSFTDCAGITRHEIGHILERTYGFKGLDLAYQAYESVFGSTPNKTDLLIYLEKSISPAAAEVTINATGKTRLSEITAEILGYNKDENEFVNEFRSMIRKERERWLNSSTHHG